MNMRLANKAAIVVGGSKGIGQACADRFASEGAKVILADIDEANGRAAVEGIRGRGGTAQFVPADGARRADIDNVVQTAVAAYGGVDIALYAAGILSPASFLMVSEAELSRCIDVNLKGAFHLGQSASRSMVADGRRGSFVAIASVGAELASASLTAYGVSKAGVVHLVKAMALSLAPHRIRANAVAPGPTRTEMLRPVIADPSGYGSVLSRTPLGRLAEPSEIASVALFLASDDSSYVTGQTIFVDGGRTVLNLTMG
jgi:glucose 1-dehydrogenase